MDNNVKGPVRPTAGIASEITYARQKELGVIPAEAELTARHAEIPAWDDMPDSAQAGAGTEMEVYAGFLEHTDYYHVGAADRHAQGDGSLRQRLIYVIVGDNGASAEEH